MQMKTRTNQATQGLSCGPWEPPTCASTMVMMTKHTVIWTPPGARGTGVCRAETGRPCLCFNAAQNDQLKGCQPQQLSGSLSRLLVQTLGKAEELYAWQSRRAACCKASQAQRPKLTRQSGDKEQCLAFCVVSSDANWQTSASLQVCPTAPAMICMVRCNCLICLHSP